MNTQTVDITSDSFAIDDNPFGDDLKISSLPLTGHAPAGIAVKTTKPRAPKASKNGIKSEGPMNAAQILACGRGEDPKTVSVPPAPVVNEGPALPVTFVYGACVIQAMLSQAIAYFVDGMPMSEGRTAQCALDKVPTGDFGKYWDYLLSLSNLLDIASREDRDALRLTLVVKELVAKGMNTDSCLRAYAHCSTGGTAYPERFRSDFTESCYAARKAQGENHGAVEAGRRAFEPVYAEFEKDPRAFTVARKAARAAK